MWSEVWRLKMNFQEGLSVLQYSEYSAVCAAMYDYV